MATFQGNRWWKGLYSLPVAVVVLTLLVLIVIAVWNLRAKSQIAERNRREAEERVIELEARKAVLAAQLSRLGTSEGEEVEIRSRFPVAREGEGVIAILDATSSGAQIELTPPSTRWWQFWK